MGAKLHQEELEEAHERAFRQVCDKVSKDVVGNNDVLKFVELLKMYTTALDETKFPNPEYRSEKLKAKLQSTYGEQITFCQIEQTGQYKSQLVYSSSMMLEKAVQSAFMLGSRDTLSDVAETLRNVILNVFENSSALRWPPTAEHIGKTDDILPTELCNFLKYIFSGKVKYTSTQTNRLVSSIGQDICRAVTNEQLLEQLMNDTSLVTYIQEYCKYRNKVREGERGKTAQFWIAYMDHVWLVLSLIRAVKTNDFPAVRRVSDLFFSFDGQNYARYLTFFLVFVANIEDSHPGATDVLQRGAISVARSFIPGNRCSVDKTMEETFMKHAKSHSGAGGIGAGVPEFLATMMHTNGGYEQHMKDQKTLTDVDEYLTAKTGEVVDYKRTTTPQYSQSTPEPDIVTGDELDVETRGITDGYQVNDTTIGYQINDKTVGYQDNDTTVEYQVNDTTVGYQDNDTIVGDLQTTEQSGKDNSSVDIDAEGSTPTGVKLSTTPQNESTTSDVISVDEGNTDLYTTPTDSTNSTDTTDNAVAGFSVSPTRILHITSEVTEVVESSPDTTENTLTTRPRGVTKGAQDTTLYTPTEAWTSLLANITDEITRLSSTESDSTDASTRENTKSAPAGQTTETIDSEFSPSSTEEFSPSSTGEFSPSSTEPMDSTQSTNLSTPALAAEAVGTEIPDRTSAIVTVAVESEAQSTHTTIGETTSPYAAQTTTNSDTTSYEVSEAVSARTEIHTSTHEMLTTESETVPTTQAAFTDPETTTTIHIPLTTPHLETTNPTTVTLTPELTSIESVFTTMSKAVKISTTKSRHTTEPQTDETTIIKKLPFVTDNPTLSMPSTIQETSSRKISTSTPTTMLPPTSNTPPTTSLPSAWVPGRRQHRITVVLIYRRQYQVQHAFQLRFRQALARILRRRYRGKGTRRQPREVDGHSDNDFNITTDHILIQSEQAFANGSYAITFDVTSNQNETDFYIPIDELLKILEDPEVQKELENELGIEVQDVYERQDDILSPQSTF
ncbi:hypothetical protein ScPMuIL_009774 [Solemya velum]